MENGNRKDGIANTSQGSKSGLAPCYVRYFCFGAKHHPGNPIYMALFIIIWLSAYQGSEHIVSMCPPVIATIFLLFIYIITSISVGKANIK